jgi:SNF family Na+-dependent transporter
MAHEKQEWGTRLGVILAVAGSAVGLGNFLRFPGNAAQNGGGAFMIPYFIALLLVGIPICWAEWTMGKYGGRKGFHSAPAIFGIFGKGTLARLLGTFAVLLPLCVYFYYTMIESWCLNYAWQYATGAIGKSVEVGAAVTDQVAASKEVFDTATGSAANGFFGAEKSQAVTFWLITFAINIYFILRGLSKGIETFCRYAMPAMLVCAVLVLVRVLTLGTPDPAHPDQSVGMGLDFMWKPEFEKLSDPKTWLAACGQIFFSLSVGFGIIINYASYMRKKDDVVLSGLTGAATNEFAEVALGGMIAVTASVVFLGVAATEANTGGTFSTGFHALPVVFARMPAGNVFGAVWFFMLFLAAITSSLSMLQPAKAFFEEALGLTHKAATGLVAALALGGNVFVLYFSKGLTALDTIDFWVGTFLIFVVAMVQIICFAWIFGVDKGLALAHDGASMRIPAFFGFVMKWISPVFLLVVFVLFCIYSVPGYVRTVIGSDGNPPDRDALLAWGVIIATGTLLLVLTLRGQKRWREHGLDIDGNHPPEED